MTDEAKTEVEAPTGIPPEPPERKVEAVGDIEDGSPLALFVGAAENFLTYSQVSGHYPDAVGHRATGCLLCQVAKHASEIGKTAE